MTRKDSFTVQQLIQLPQFGRLVQGFEQTAGLKMFVYDAAGNALGDEVTLPRFCQILRDAGSCPLLQDPGYHETTVPEIRQTCAGQGHVVVPVIDGRGQQVLNLVSSSARFGAPDMEALTRISFDQKVFPDDMVSAVEELPMAVKDRVLFAAQILYAGLHGLASGALGRASALESLITHVSTAAPGSVAEAILDAVVEYTAAEVGHLVLLDDRGEVTAEVSHLGDALPVMRPIVRGVAQWVIHAGQPVQIADLTASAWCRYLANGAPPQGAVTGTPVAHEETVFGSLVVGGRDTSQVSSWSAALASLAEAGGPALLLVRRLVRGGDGNMIDQTGAYNLQFLQEVLQKELSRADRHQRDLSLVLFRATNRDRLIDELGDSGFEAALTQLVSLLRQRTRKVNTLARIGEGDFCLVVPEARKDVAERIALDLSQVATAEPFTIERNGDTARVTIELEATALGTPHLADNALLESLLSALN